MSVIQTIQYDVSQIWEKKPNPVKKRFFREAKAAYEKQAKSGRNDTSETVQKAPSFPLPICWILGLLRLWFADIVLTQISRFQMQTKLRPGNAILGISLERVLKTGKMGQPSVRMVV